MLGKVLAALKLFFFSFIWPEIMREYAVLPVFSVDV